MQTSDKPPVRRTRAGVFGLAALAVVLATACTPAGRDDATGATAANATSAAPPVDAPPVGVSNVGAPNLEAPNVEASAVPGASRPSSATTTPAPVETSPESAPGTPSDTIGGDGSPIQLDALTAADVSGAALSGELACSFTGGDGAPLLQAMGIVASREPAQGVVKVAGHVEPVRTPGGFDAMTRDPVFTGQGKTIRIVQTGTALGGGESPARPATLTYQRADGASRTFAGRWQCGP
ncbi:MAG TPA: hypothetical protein VLK29_06335 [Luteimonas sp.]|nr:hypothetical protein [Luteimonas sp.]